MVPFAERRGVVESSDNTSSKAGSNMSAASAGRAAECISASLAGNKMEKLSHRLHPPKQRQRLMTECQYVLSGATENKFFHETDKWWRQR